jgi:hypothetical protein
VLADPIKTRPAPVPIDVDRNVATKELLPALSIPKTATMGHTGDSIIVLACAIADSICPAKELSGPIPNVFSRSINKDLKLVASPKACAPKACARKSNSICTKESASGSREIFDTEFGGSERFANGRRTDCSEIANEGIITRIERRKTYVSWGFPPFSSLATYFIR